MSDIIKDQYVMPKPRKREAGKFKSRFTFELRKNLQNLLEANTPTKKICEKLDVSRSSLWHEKQRCKGKYNAEEAQKDSENKEKSYTYKGTGFPISAQNKLKALCKLLESCKTLEKTSLIQENIDCCLDLLGRLGIYKKHYSAAISEELKKEIAILNEKGITQSEIAARLKISRTTVCRYIKEGAKNYEEYIKNKWGRNA